MLKPTRGPPDQIVGKKGGEGADALVREVGVGHEAVEGKALNREKGEFRIHGGGVGPQLGHEAFRSQNGGILGNFQGHPAHQNHDPDGIFLGLLDRHGALESEDGVVEKVFLALHPSTGLEQFLEGLADGGFKLRPADLLLETAFQANDPVGGNRAGLGVGFGEGLGLRIRLVKDNQRVGGQIREVGGGGRDGLRSAGRKRDPEC